MFAKTAKEVAVAKALQTIASYSQQIAYDPTISIDTQIRTLQWIYKKIPELNKLLIAINTDRIKK